MTDKSGILWLWEDEKPVIWLVKKEAFFTGLETVSLFLGFWLQVIVMTQKKNDSQSSQKCFRNAVRSESTNWKWTWKISFSFFFLGQKYRARGNSFKVPISSKVGSFYLFLVEYQWSHHRFYPFIYFYWNVSEIPMIVMV